MRKCILVVLTVTLVLLTVAMSEESRRVIVYSEIGSSVDVQGRLGVAFGTVVDAEGRWESGKTGTLLIVTHVNKAIVIEPIAFNSTSVSFLSKQKASPVPLEGEAFKCRVFETGGFEGVPPDAYSESDELDIPVGSLFRFDLKLVVVSLELVSKP